jgi:carbonic anhydrase
MLTGIGGLVLGGTAITAVALDTADTADTADTPEKVDTPEKALTLLKEGNARWVEGRLKHPNLTLARRKEVAKEQHPFAVILGCIDSRVPPEFVFDRGLGDLFVVRDAAAAPDSFVEGSLEYGPVQDGTPLVVVLGHQRCGAVTAGVKALRAGRKLDGHLAEVEEAIRPAWEVVKDLPTSSAEEEIENTTAELVRQTVTKISADSLIVPLIEKGTVRVIGASYSLDAGGVTFYE